MKWSQLVERRSFKLAFSSTWERETTPFDQFSTTVKSIFWWGWSIKRWWTSLPVGETLSPSTDPSWKIRSHITDRREWTQTNVMLVHVELYASPHANAWHVNVSLHRSSHNTWVRYQLHVFFQALLMKGFQLNMQELWPWWSEQHEDQPIARPM